MKYSVKKPLSADERAGLSAHTDLLAHLLFYRGILDDAAAEAFLSPDYDAGVHDPFLLKDAEKAADRIVRAIRDGEKIAVFADYDADGIPGAAIWDDFFKRISFSGYVIYIPHRHDEGFGLNENAIRELAEKGAKVLMTVDCGITDAAPVATANSLRMDVIITDHHEAPPLVPAAFAIVDPKQPGCGYPDKNLCGSGVAYKLIQAVLKIERFGLKDGMEKWLLDLVGMATLSDMVPLVGENRIFAAYGLQVLRKSPRKGLMRLFDKLKIAQRHVTEDDIAFMVTPRINAASRMGVPMDAFKLLSASTDDDANIYADHLDSINSERKGVVASLVKEVKKTVRERHGEAVPSVIVLGDPEWRPSLLGLAANSCAEEFGRPVFLWGRDGSNEIKGSCRSEGSTHVVELMRAVPAGVFSKYGGHKHSGGFAVASDQIHFLEQRLNEAADKLRDARYQISDAGYGAIEADAELSLDSVDMRLYKEIDRLAPFGVGNPKPVFLFKSVKPADIRIFGKGNEHVELVFRGSDGSKLPAIAFFGISEPWAKAVRKGMPIDLAASVELSMFRGRPELRLRIVDVIYS
ncbi:MAG: single-stranded-DNA-specific exonuclease RecJ [Patescibacteria group bacterium]|nr:single-stranded-DNA-specific exonuclease RecJ [Patescibacteria group bacterium]